MFISKDYEIKLRIKLHNYFAALFGRKDLLRKFCTDNGVDYIEKQNKHYIFPEKSLIEHKELKYLSSLRNKLILSFYDDYSTAQIDNLKQQELLTKRIEEQDTIIKTCRSRLAKNQKLLEKATSSINIIHYENVTATLESRIGNEIREKNSLKDRLRDVKTQYKTNTQNWNKQLEILDDLFIGRQQAFEKNISKTIRKKFNYTDFYSYLDDYSDEVKKVLKGAVYA